MKRKIAMTVSFALILTLILSACSGGSKEASKDANGGTPSVNGEQNQTGRGSCNAGCVHSTEFANQ